NSRTGKERAMKTNMGLIDQGIRLILAAVIAVLYITKQISGTLAVILGILAVIFVVTSLCGFCPLYVPLRISTRKKKKTAA
ncbi:MAG: YgaP family membrane protein, partial [Candidatus Aminicenantales bacterium]